MRYSITVLGLGFVGLTTALAFAEKGNQVYGYDVDYERRDVIKNGRLPFIEPGLDIALYNHLNKNFIVVDTLEKALKESNFIFLCVGTPSKENGEVDLTHIYSALDSIYLFRK